MYKLSNVCELYSIWSKGTALYTQWANKCEIGYPELIVLYAMSIRKNLTQKSITEEFGLVKPTVSTVIRDLKKRGLIFLEQSSKDGREKLVVFTESGERYAEKIIQPLLKAEERVSRKIGNERMEHTLETMELFNLLFEKEVKKGAE